jgi:catechol 2,3-dioxygenase-like lactoylglutathione lyase family enzyme
MKLGYVILYVPDVHDAVEFYEQAFGLRRRFVHESGAYAEMETGETALAFASEDLAATHGFEFAATRADRVPPSFEVALVTEDVEARYAQSLEGGAVPVKSPERKPWGQTVSYVRDDNGYLVEICSPVGSA